jgi:asparagine synthase (glutamine-hydrolysing)
MCGIAGIVSYSEKGNSKLNNIRQASSCLSLRGPDHEGVFEFRNIALGHRRLSIIDTSAAANQPMFDDDDRFAIIFNGEFFNYREHRDRLLAEGHRFKTHSDTEVVLRLYMIDGPSCLEKINGFFALAIHDKLNNTLFIARDRMGIKPLFYYSDDDNFIFGSEIKSLTAAGIPRVPDPVSVMNYFQFNYIPGPWSIFENVRKLRPGHYMILDLNNRKEINEICYYFIPENFASGINYSDAKTRLRSLLEESVVKRLIADVPLGAFLSGGIDSSIIVALASLHTQHLNTFSIGFKNAPRYDETGYARLVADKYKTNHTVFELTDEDLYGNLFSVLDYLDEPFADSSALPVNILSMHTRKHVKVALSGDGADEMFGGYNKHRAEWMRRNKPFFNVAVNLLSPLLSAFSGARHSAWSNKIRQLHRYSEGSGMSASERYWRWCAFIGEKELEKLLKKGEQKEDYRRRKNEILKPLGSGQSMNDIFRMDMKLVLPDDMLVKVDRMSMANSLEVRVPFLDYEVVNFAFGLPEHFKIDVHSQKKILREAFRDELPRELFHRPKQGFEVPLLKWMRTGLKSMITDELLNKSFIERQNLFKPEEIDRLQKRLFSHDPGEIEPRMWGLIVFQYWWKKYMD